MAIKQKEIMANGNPMMAIIKVVVVLLLLGLIGVVIWIAIEYKRVTDALAKCSKQSEPAVCPKSDSCPECPNPVPCPECAKQESSCTPPPILIFAPDPPGNWLLKFLTVLPEKTQDTVALGTCEVVQQDGSSALFFDGLGHYAMTWRSPTLKGDWTVCVSFKQTGNVTEHQVIIHIPDDLMIHIQGTTQTLLMRVNQTYVSLGIQCKLNTWYDLVIVNVSGTVTGYVNGVEQGRILINRDINSNGQNIRLGWGNENLRVFSFWGHLRYFHIHEGRALKPDNMVNQPGH